VVHELERLGWACRGAQRSRPGYPIAGLDDGVAAHYLDDDLPMDSMLNATFGTSS
jgi:hypothetical protein